ncbi:hypothetical protein V1498_13850 [Peribacillus sp. SCS-26]|uniref:hypothetical protein n=1 Tax=Paraperibacillus marinus TaxID=3115295 RepID=UPI003906689B
MKKLMSAILSAALIFSPVGHYVFHDQGQKVEARGYKSGKRSFNTNGSTTKNSPYFQTKKQSPSTSSKSAAQKRNSGGFMRGLMYGGIAGLLFGSMFANMGAFGSLLGMMVNLVAMYFVFSLIRSFFAARRNKRQQEDYRSWRN